MSEAKVRWGILSTAEIARKNWKAVFNSGNGVITAVASREQQRSREFIELCQREAPFEELPRALAGYEALLSTKDVDAVYIQLVTGCKLHRHPSSDRKSTRLNSSHRTISYAVFCLKKKKT